MLMRLNERSCRGWLNANHMRGRRTMSLCDGPDCLFEARQHSRDLFA